MAWEKNILAHDSFEKKYFGPESDRKKYSGQTEKLRPPWKSNGRSLMSEIAVILNVLIIFYSYKFISRSRFVILADELRT